jgi:hypothetical protein
MGVSSETLLEIVSIDTGMQIEELSNGNQQIHQKSKVDNQVRTLKAKGQSNHRSTSTKMSQSTMRGTNTIPLKGKPVP